MHNNILFICGMQCAGSSSSTAARQMLLASVRREIEKIYRGLSEWVSVGPRVKIAFDVAALTSKYCGPQKKTLLPLRWSRRRAAAIYIVTRKSVIAVPGSNIAWRNATFICTYFSLCWQIYIFAPRSHVHQMKLQKKLLTSASKKLLVYRGMRLKPHHWLEIVLKFWPKYTCTEIFFYLYPCWEKIQWFSDFLLASQVFTLQ
jgi:hypothetical protein